MMESAHCYAAEDRECYQWVYPFQSNNINRYDKKRRFSQEQIKSLESMFETQTKLEPRQKVQLARELSLQPRQVAIWFQNKRARWKSKQLERQYSSLRKEYDSLLTSFESLKKDREALVKKLQNLAELLEQPQEKIKKEGDLSDIGDTNDREVQRPSHDEDKNLKYFREEGPETIQRPIDKHLNLIS